jgi:hypothetical protein
VEGSVKMEGICEPFAIFLSLKQFDHMLEFLWRHGSLVNRIHYSTIKTKTKQKKERKENRHPLQIKNVIKLFSVLAIKLNSCET